MHSELLAPSDRCVNMCSLDHGHELTFPPHACRQCLSSPRLGHFSRIETPGMKCRDVAVQSQTTHSFVAGAQHPRFNGVIGFQGIVEPGLPYYKQDDAAYGAQQASGSTLRQRRA